MFHACGQMALRRFIGSVGAYSVATALTQGTSCIDYVVNSFNTNKVKLNLWAILPPQTTLC